MRTLHARGVKGFVTELKQLAAVRGRHLVAKVLQRGLHLVHEGLSWSAPGESSLAERLIGAAVGGVGAVLRIMLGPMATARPARRSTWSG